MIGDTAIIFGLFILFFVAAFFSGYVYFSWRSVFQGTAGKPLKEVLEKFLKQSGEIKRDMEILKDEVALLEEEKTHFFQKSAFMRFNPFGDTGGDQSFIWVCLDNEDNGIILSSLHGRDGTRVYGKKIKSGEAINHKLSHEEQDVLEKAIQQHVVKNRKEV